MKIMSDEEFGDTVVDGSMALHELTNQLLFDKHGRRAYTMAEIGHEMKVALGFIEAYTIQNYLLGAIVGVQVKDHVFVTERESEEIFECKNCEAHFGASELGIPWDICPECGEHWKRNVPMG